MLESTTSTGHAYLLFACNQNTSLLMIKYYDSHENVVARAAGELLQSCCKAIAGLLQDYCRTIAELLQSC